MSNDFSMQHFFYKKVNKKLNQIIETLDFFTQEVNGMSMELDMLAEQVAETKTIEASVIVLLDGIKAQLDSIIVELEEAKVDATTLIALRDDLDTSEQALAAAVSVFVPPVEPPVEPEPEL